MQDMKIYILIEDKENEAEVRIDGSLETLRGLLCAIRAELAGSAPIIAPPAEDPKQVEGVAHVTG